MSRRLPRVSERTSNDEPTFYFTERSADSDRADGPPMWVDVALGWAYDECGHRHPLDVSQQLAVRRAREMHNRVLEVPGAGSQRDTDVDIDGWAEGAKYTTDFGLWEGRPKMDMRWLELRPSPPRSHDLRTILQSKLDQQGFIGLRGRTDGLATVSQLARTRECTRILVYSNHPRRGLIRGSDDDRQRFTDDERRISEIVDRGCRWCGLPTSEWCRGVPNYSCRGAVCTTCTEWFGRCPDCTSQIGWPPMPSTPLPSEPTRLQFERTLHRHVVQMHCRELWELTHLRFDV